MTLGPRWSALGPRWSALRAKCRALAARWSALRPQWRALAAVGLLAAGGVLIGLGIIVGDSAEGPPGEGATDVSQEVGAPAPDTADLETSPARHEGGDIAPATTPVAPQQLRIPSLGINAPVVPITPEGSSLIPPSDPQTVGWWSAGARPGASRGTAILTGHTVSTGGGVFDDLEHIRPGQHVQILSGDSHLSLRVASVNTYHKTALAEHAAEIFDQSAASRVALVTCEDWDGAEYLSNVVVIATPKV